MSNTHSQHTNPKSDIEISQNASCLPISQVASTKLGLAKDQLIAFGNDKAKVKVASPALTKHERLGRLILVTAINPTPSGEGKTTTTVGLGDALQLVGKKSAICLREPSLGPCFGMKGGAAGGGYSQVVPMEDINLHFTGDFHAIGAANNLLAAMIDNHIHWGNQKKLDTRRITWRRVLDMNDRSLRTIVTGIGAPTNGVAREANFDITVASEVMAILCLSETIKDLENRLGKMVIGRNMERKLVPAAELNANGAMTALLKDAFLPNLVQSLEGTPALVHGGPFANIAHGCNSVVATKTALRLADYVVTEAGFGADLGAEKFFNIKCRQSGLTPDCAVLVATIRALKMHGGLDRDRLHTEDIKSLNEGCENLARHVTNLRKFGIPVIVALNSFTSDTEAERHALKEYCSHIGVDIEECNHWAAGGIGAQGLAEKVISITDNDPGEFKFLYSDDEPLRSKIETIAMEIYRAGSIDFDSIASRTLDELQDSGYGALPICIAKTPYSFSTDPALKGAPSGHQISINDIRLSAGAGFVIVACGEIMTMPGLPSKPAATEIGLDKYGQLDGLF